LAFSVRFRNEKRPTRRGRALAASECRLVDDPLTLFQSWLDDARAAEGPGAEAFAVATATAGGEPSVRMVLMKGLDEHGLVFFTNYSSRKGRELGENPCAALLFHWPSLGRQVRVDGPVTRVDRADSEAYARSRPRQSQLSALASPQSEVVPDREWLERRVEELDREHAGAELPVREDWGGYRVEPEVWEFWQHRDNRLHDRHRYERTADGWRVERLAP
jgi:pyridoxamine 5'-phosphate oxidase